MKAIVLFAVVFTELVVGRKRHAAQASVVELRQGYVLLARDFDCGDASMDQNRLSSLCETNPNFATAGYFDQLPLTCRLRRCAGLADFLH